LINTTWSGLYVSEAIAGELMAISESFGIEARIVGSCEMSDTKKLTIISKEGNFNY